jgi:hypothetical protein
VRNAADAGRVRVIFHPVLETEKRQQHFVLQISGAND